MAFQESALPQLLAAAAVGRTTQETIKFIKQNHSEDIEREWEFVCEHGLLNLLSNTKRRKAKLLVGQQDLLSAFEFPTLVPNGRAPGTNEKVSDNFVNMSKRWLMERIDEVSHRPSRKEKELEELRKLFGLIDEHCSDGESIRTGLLRANGKEQ